MNKKLFLAMVLGLIVVLVFTGVSFAQQTLKCSIMEPKEITASQACALFAELVEKYTDGKYKVDVYYGGALGSSDDVFEQLMDGVVHISWNGISHLEIFNDDLKIFSLNWAFDDNDHIAKFCESEKFEGIKAELEKLNIKLIGYYGYRTPRNLLTKRPILGLEDIQGLLLRVPPQPMYQKSWAAVGANPTQIAYAEAYMALRQNVVEGMEGNIEGFYGKSFDEVASYVTYSKHLLNPWSVVITADLFNDMDKDTQNAFLRAAKESGKWFSDMAGAYEEKCVKEMMKRNGVVFIRIDTTPLSEKVRPIAQELEAAGEWSEGLFDYVRNLVK